LRIRYLWLKRYKTIAESSIEIKPLEWKQKVK